MSKLILLISLIFFAAFGGFHIGQQTKSAASAEMIIAASEKKPTFIKILEAENIERFARWEDDNGKKFFNVIRQLNEPCDKDYTLKSCQLFSVYDETGQIFYEFKDFGITSISGIRIKPNSSQIMIQSNGGGTDDNLTILDYKVGKFTRIEIEDDTSVRGGWWTMPQYKSGVTGAYFKPSQLIIIQQIGGADDSPTASVFRFKENKFQKAGEIRMQELGDFIEKQIAKNSK